MDETLNFLEKLNWFLEPIANLVIFMFTTKTGVILLLSILLLITLFSIYNALKDRQLAYMAAKSYGNGRIPFFEKLYIIGNVIGKMSIRVISNVPVFLMVFVFLLLVVGVSKGISGMNEFVHNQERIKELQSILKQLDQRYKVAEIEVINYSYFSDESQLKVRFFDYSEQGFVNQDQEITLKGNDIYFDALVLNFDYSEIASGNKTNLVLPYRIFSEDVPQEEGVRLSLTDDNGIPLIYKRNENEIYGMDHDKYNQHLKEIMEYITDKEKAREAGIRSVYGNAVHKKVRKGDVLSIWVEQTGGLVIKEVGDF